jgi:hypothetical protein
MSEKFLRDKDSSLTDLKVACLVSVKMNVVTARPFNASHVVALCEELKPVVQHEIDSIVTTQARMSRNRELEDNSCIYMLVYRKCQQMYLTGQAVQNKPLFPSANNDQLPVTNSAHWDRMFKTMGRRSCSSPARPGRIAHHQIQELAWLLTLRCSI